MNPKRLITIALIALVSCTLYLAMDKPAWAQANPLNSDNYFKTEFVFEAKVICDRTRVSIDNAKYGTRGIVWIIGGTFKGPKMEGTIIPGGADWQQSRPDGVKELDARYTLKTNDGVIIYINNKVITRDDPGNKDLASPNQYRRSVIYFEAPIDSKYAWLNQNLFIGTLTSATTDKEAAVIVRVWKVL
jgi:hypothetical protein